MIWFGGHSTQVVVLRQVKSLVFSTAFLFVGSKKCKDINDVTYEVARRKVYISCAGVQTRLPLCTDKYRRKINTHDAHALKATIVGMRSCDVELF